MVWGSSPLQSLEMLSKRRKKRNGRRKKKDKPLSKSLGEAVVNGERLLTRTLSSSFGQAKDPANAPTACDSQ